jgi:hypothetical protein
MKIDKSTLLNLNKGPRTVVSHRESDKLKVIFSKFEGNEILNLVCQYPLSGCDFYLPADLDLSGLGVEMRWMNPSEMLSEATESYPGIAALECGYIPIGICLEGSGDPYFAKWNGKGYSLVRIPHLSVSEDHLLDENSIEVVSENLYDFINKSEIS